MNTQHLKLGIGLIIASQCFLAGCQSTPSTNQQQQAQIAISAPQWTREPPLDTTTTLYGLGEGNTRQQAIQNALADLTAKLGVRVNAQFDTSLSVKDRGYELIKRDSTKTVSTETQGIVLNQYQIEQSFSPLPTQFYILLSTDKRRLAQETQMHLNQMMTESPWLQTDWTKQGHLTQYLQMQKIQPRFAAFQRQVALLKTLAPQEDDSSLLAYQQEWQNQFQTTAKSLKFSVEATSQASQVYAKLLEQRLAKDGLLASTPVTAQKITVTLNETLNQAYGFVIMQAQLQINTFEEQQLKSGQSINIKGQGLKQDQAELQATQRFSELLSTQDILQILGLTTNQP